MKQVTGRPIIRAAQFIYNSVMPSLRTEIILDTNSKIIECIDMLYDDPEVAREQADNIKIYIGDKVLNDPELDLVLNQQLKLCNQIKLLASNIIELNS